MCMIDSFDGDGWNLNGGSRVARKQHVCDNCHRTIEPKERYEFLTYLYDDDLNHVKHCAHCLAVASWLQRVCGGWLWGEELIAVDLQEHWDESPVYRSQYLGRALVGIRRKWLCRDGSLMPVPAAFDGPVPHEGIAA